MSTDNALLKYMSHFYRVFVYLRQEFFVKLLGMIRLAKLIQEAYISQVLAFIETGCLFALLRCAASHQIVASAEYPVHNIHLANYSRVDRRTNT